MLVTLGGIDNKVQHLEKDKDSRYEDGEGKKTIDESIRDLGLDCGKLPSFTVRLNFIQLCSKTNGDSRKTNGITCPTIRTTGRV